MISFRLVMMMALLCVFIDTAQPQAQMTQDFNEKANTAYSFTDAIGLNSLPFHTLNGRNDPGYCTNIFVPAMTDLGVKHFRSNIPWNVSANPEANPTYIAFNCAFKAGLRPILTVTLQKTPGFPIGYSQNPSVGGHTELITNILSVVKYLRVDNIDAIEGVNEYYNKNRDNAQVWQQNLYTYSSLVYKILKSDLLTKSIKIIGPSLDGATPTQIYDGIVDYGNMHFYDMPYSTQAASYQAKNALQQASSYVGLPKQITEMGFSNCTVTLDRSSPNYWTSHICVPEDIAAKNIGRQLLRYFTQGYSRIYIYQLMDSGTDLAVRDENFGLLTYSADDAIGSVTPKPIYYALKNLMHILSDDQQNNNGTDNLSFSLLGQDLSNVKHVLFEKSDGSYYLAIWQAVDSTKNPVSVEVQLILPKQVSNVQVFDTLASDLPVSNTENIKTVTLQVTDYVKIVKLML